MSTTNNNPQILGDVIIMRGLPGIGKTSLAHKLLANLDVGHKGIILAADDFFTKGSVDKKVYDFDKEKLEEAYKWNFGRFKEAIKAKRPLIIIDNSNIKLFHFWQYIDYGQRNNYRVSILTIPHNDVSDRELEQRTPHGINRGTIYKMRKEFEWELIRKS